MSGGLRRAGPEGMLSAETVEEAYDFMAASFRSACNRGRVSGAVYVDEEWYAPERSVLVYLNLPSQMKTKETEHGESEDTTEPC